MESGNDSSQGRPRPNPVRIESRIPSSQIRDADQKDTDYSFRKSGSGFGNPVEPILEEIVNPTVDDSERKRPVLANMRLTSSIGLVIFVELFVIGITVPAIGQLFTLHAILGYMLIPPLIFKMFSTGFRFLKYYTKDPKYSLAGPPHTLLRIAAPFLVLATALLFVSGIALMVVGPYAASAASWKQIHQASFILWFGLTALHVVSYIPRASYQFFGDLGLRSFGSFKFSKVKVRGRNARLTVIAIALGSGLLLALALYTTISPWVKLFGAGLGVGH
ncbi:MAG: hypothetical protein M0019_04405 [Actinomycetota bacterium]|nr:hypothetical protein [Actinomycetota bacterium]